MTMWDELKASITETIKQNGNNEITGNILQNVLLTMVSALGENAQMAGEATPTTNPGTPDNKVFYVAQQPGVYSNFGGYTLQSGTIAFLFWDSEQWLATTVTIGELNAIAVIKDWNGNTLAITSKSVQLPNPLFSDVLSAAQGGETLVQALAKKANLASPALTGSPTAPTPAQNAAGTRIATVGFVRDYIAGGGGSSGDPNVIEIIYGYNNQPLPVINKAVHLPSVSGSNVDIGGVDLNIVLQTIENTLSQKANAADVYTRTQSDALFFTQEDATFWLNLKADLYSPAFRGIPTAPTAANDSVPTQIATLQYVINKISEAGSGGDVNKIEKIYAYGPNATEVEVTDREAWLPNVPSTAVIVEGVGADLDAVLQSMLQSISNRAMKNNASLTGTPTAPTPTASSPDNQIATKKYVLDNAASGGNVRSNWQQNNPAADSYVENRTHYLQGSQSVFTAAPVDITPQAGFGGGTASGSMTLTRGKFYSVTISDGVTTYVNAESLKPKQDSNGNWYLSRDWEVTTAVGAPQGTDAFLVWDNGSGSVMIALTAAQSGQMEVSVSELAYVKLPLGYIPDEVANVDLTGYATETWVGSNYVAKETGKGLSTNDFTLAEKTKLADIEAGAEKNVQGDWAQNDTTADDHIKNRTHYVEFVSTSVVWEQSGCSVGSGTTSPGGYPATFNITTGDKYNVTISQGSTSKTYEGLTAEYDSVFNGLALRKNWSDSMGVSDTSTDALLLVVQPSNVVLRSADIYGENCTVQVSEVTETIHKLDPKYLPDNVNQLDSITTSKSGKVTTVTMEQTNGTQTQFQVTDGNDGTNGKSAYQVAVDNGYSGTEAQCLASLKGADGDSLGEVELVQQLSQDDDKVPSAKAVQYGIEVWRDEVDTILYTNSNLEFNGTNKVDTGINLYNPEIDYVVKFTISNLTWKSATNNSAGSIVGCGNPASPYRGWSIQRGSSASALSLWLDGSRRFNTVVERSSPITILVQKIGNDYTFQINNGTLNTYTSTTDNSSATTLIMGGENNRSTFTLNNIIVRNIISKDVQLYNDYTKGIKIYPKTTVENVEDLERRLSAIQIQEGLEFNPNAYIKLTDNQCTCINNSDVVTYIFIARSMNSSHPNYGAFGCPITGGIRMPLYYNGQISVSQSNTTNENNIIQNGGFIKDMNMVIVNRVTGLCKLYYGTTYIGSRTRDSAITDAFIKNNLLYWRSTNDRLVFYDIHIYNEDLSKMLEYIKDYNNVGGVLGVAGVFNNKFIDYWNYENVMTSPTFWNYGSTTQTLGSDGKYHYTTTSSDWKNFYITIAGWTYFQKRIWEIEIISGEMKIHQKGGEQNRDTTWQWFDVYNSENSYLEPDENGDVIIGVGTYTLVEYASAKWSVVKIKGEPFECRAIQLTIKYVVCPVHLSFNALYDEKVYDDQAKVLFPLYSSEALTTKASFTRNFNKLQSPTTFEYPCYPGQIRIADGKVYASTDWNTWKQISN